MAVGGEHDAHRDRNLHASKTPVLHAPADQSAPSRIESGPGLR